jgi:ABC-type bacteriocin/lantibiotic exporter with double-glycine peptidase domain
MTQLIALLKESIRLVRSGEKSQKFRLAYLRRLSPYMKQHWKMGLIGSIFMIVLSFLALPSPYLMKLTFDKVLVAKNIRLLNLVILTLIAVQFIRSIFSILTDYHFNLFSQGIMAKLKIDLFYKILRLPLSFFDKNQSGYILSRIGEVEGLNLFFSSTITRILISFFEFVFCLTILFYLNWRLTIIALAILPMFGLATKFYSKAIKKLARETYEKGATISRRIQDSLSGVDIIKSFAAERRETEKVRNHLDEFKNLSIKKNIVFTFSSEILSLLGALGGFVVLWYSGMDIIKGSFTIGSYIAFSAYVGRLYGPTQILASIGVTFQPAVVALERVAEIMDLTGEEDDKNKIEIKGIDKGIELRNIYFSYDTRQVLSDINLKIVKGDKILISGPNGSGKTTIVRLILGLYKAQHGIILIDGQDINEVSLSSLRERISIVSQNTFLFNDTIRNNILYSRPEAKKAEIEEAACLSGAYEFIKTLESEFDTEIGERGVKLSGGERQKISIARAILKDADLIIFDEATTHLDEETENKLEKLLYDKFRDKMCIIISHKNRSMVGIDKIYFLKQGEIVNIAKPYPRR